MTLPSPPKYGHWLKGAPANGGLHAWLEQARPLINAARSLAQPVATAADLPAAERDGSLRITQDDMHLWVWDDALPGWTDLGSLRGADGAGSSDADIAARVSTEGTQTRAAVESVATAVAGVPTAVTDAVQEWWVYPLVTHQAAPYPRAVFGGISSDGTVVACELDYATRTTVRHPVGTAGVDDHNAPALAVTPGRRSVIMWNNHAQDNDMHIRVAARADDLRDWLPVQTHLIGATGLSYAQIHRIEADSTPDTDVYWVLTRRGTDRWGLFTLTVDHATGAHAVSAVHSIIYTPGLQCYCSTAPARGEDGQQVIRAAFGFNPAAGTTPLYYFEIDTVTGAITSPGGAVTANYRTPAGVPFQLDVLTPAVPALPAGRSRRLFYVRSGPAGPAMCFADWDNATPDAAVYHHAVFTGSPPDPFDGLYLPLGANAVAADAPDLDVPGGWTYETAFRCHDAPTGNTYFLWRYDAGQEWARAALTSSRQVLFRRNAVTGGIGETTIPGALPGAWTDPIGIRLVYLSDVGGESRVRVFYTLDPLAASPTWVEHTTGAGHLISAATALKPSTSPLRIGWTVGTGRDVYHATLTDDTTASVVADGDFTSWPKGTTPWVDGAGKSWTLDGGGLVYSTASSQSWPAVPLPGVAGPRVGYNAGSNYIPGMAYPEPAFDDTVYVARRNPSDTESTVEEWTRDESGTYTSTVLATSADKLCRPAPPIGGGPSPTLYTALTHYGVSFTDYAGNIVRAPRT